MNQGLDSRRSSRIVLGERFEICREVAAYKGEHGIPMMQPERVAEVRARYLARGAAVNLPEDFTAALFELLIGATCKLERLGFNTPSPGPVQCQSFDVVKR